MLVFKHECCGHAKSKGRKEKQNKTHQARVDRLNFAYILGQDETFQPRVLLTKDAADGTELWLTSAFRLLMSEQDGTAKIDIDFETLFSLQISGYNFYAYFPSAAAARDATNSVF